EFCHIASSVNTRNVGLQIFIRHDTASYLDWCALEELRIQCDAQANTYHISLNLATLLRRYIVGNAVFRDDCFNFIAVNDFDIEFPGNVIYDFAAIRVQTTAQPDWATHKPGCMQLSHCEAIT